MNPAEIPSPETFINEAVEAHSKASFLKLLQQLPIVDEHDYVFEGGDASKGWREGHFHWFPVGKDRGNSGRIKLAGSPDNPLGERTVNSMEAMIELERQRELVTDPEAEAPATPREAVLRYFDLPPLDELPFCRDPICGKKPYEHARALARRIRVRLLRQRRPVEYAVLIEDDGIGQPPARIHSTLLSLGHSDKADKRYLVGVFGQGGSSAYMACELSWMISRRARDVLGDDRDGVGWTAVKRITPKGRRDVYWAYLAAHPDGRVPCLPVAAAESIGFVHGTCIAHLKYNFGKSESAR